MTLLDTDTLTLLMHGHERVTRGVAEFELLIWTKLNTAFKRIAVARQFASRCLGGLRMERPFATHCKAGDQIVSSTDCDNFSNIEIVFSIRIVVIYSALTLFSSSPECPSIGTLPLAGFAATVRGRRVTGSEPLWPMVSWQQTGRPRQTVHVQRRWS